jgi:hypothetical protein
MPLSAATALSIYPYSAYTDAGLQIAADLLTLSAQDKCVSKWNAS